MSEKLTQEAIEKRKEYYKEYYKNHKENIKKSRINYWNRKAKGLIKQRGIKNEQE